MSDQETNQLLRELIAIQREHLEYVRRDSQAYEENTKRYQASSELYKTLSHRPWERAIRIITMLGVVILLGYIILH
jgi:hypothetical protein